MSDTSRFLDAFNGIEENLRVRTGKVRDGNSSFVRVLRQMDKHPIIRRYGKILKELTDLRNQLVHRSGAPLMQPTEYAIETTLKIHALLTRPPTVLDISSKLVCYCTLDTPLHEVLQYMKEKKFTQMPVKTTKEKDGEWVATLSSESIQRWITAKIEPDMFLVEDTSVAHITEYLDPFVAEDFLPKNAEAFTITEKFDPASERRINALFVTERGRIGECIQGIITPHDLVKLQEILS